MKTTILDTTGSSPKDLGAFAADAVTASTDALHFIIRDAAARREAFGRLLDCDCEIEKDATDATRFSVSLATDYEFAFSC